MDGNPDTFCPAVDRAVPLYYMMSLGSLDGDATAAAYEVAVAPALTGPLNEAASGAPSVVAPPFQRWAARTALAVGAFKAAGATDAQVASFGKSYADQIEALTDAGGAQTPPDPVAAAAAAGIDRNRLATAANSFVPGQRDVRVVRGDAEPGRDAHAGGPAEARAALPLRRRPHQLRQLTPAQDVLTRPCALHQTVSARCPIAAITKTTGRRRAAAGRASTD